MSDMAAERRTALSTARVYLIAAVGLALFGGIYELFSHGVYSYAMLYAFGFPLAGGALPALLIGLSERCALPGKPVRNAWHSAMATWSVGSMIQGVLEIYGTTNRLTMVYWIAGGVFAAAAVILHILECRKQKSSQNV